MGDSDTVEHSALLGHTTAVANPLGSKCIVVSARTAFVVAMEETAFAVAAYTGLEVAVASSTAVAVAPCKHLHLSQNMHHKSTLEANHRLDSPYPRAQLSDRRCNISLLSS